ncbi:MAG: hypothetical protein PHY12_12635 [Eubacteriales bacterium]|nr:hypothetical protein [Eubacteriales bacterium]
MNMKGKRVLMALAGVVIVGICVGLFRIAGFGVDPFTALCVGMANAFHTTYAIAFTVITALMLLIALVADRSFVGISTALNLFGTGVIADGCVALLGNLAAFQTVLGRAALLAVALVILCIGSSLYFTANLGVSGYDAMSLIAAKKHWGPFRVCRIVADILCVAAGYLLGAVIGIGTVLTALCMGPVIQWFNTHLSEPMLREKARESAV